jgi:hypothetical protein
LEFAFSKLNSIVCIAGMTRPTESKIAAGPRNTRFAIGFCFRPLARPAMKKMIPKIAKKPNMATKIWANLGALVLIKLPIAHPSIKLIHDTEHLQPKMKLRGRDI